MPGLSLFQALNTKTIIEIALSERLKYNTNNDKCAFEIKPSQRLRRNDVTKAIGKIEHAQTVLPLSVIEELKKVTKQGSTKEALRIAVEYTIANY